MELINEYRLIQIKNQVDLIKNEWVKFFSTHLQDINLLDINIDDIPVYLVTRGVITNVFFEEMASLTKWTEEILSTREYNTIEVTKLEVELDKVLHNLKTLGTDYTDEPRL